MGQELLTLLEHLSSSSLFRRIDRLLIRGAGTAHLSGASEFIPTFEADSQVTCNWVFSYFTRRDLSAKGASQRCDFNEIGSIPVPLFDLHSLLS